MTTLIIIQARMGSYRLPGKTMKKLLGKPMLEYILEYMKFVKFADKIIVATSTLKEDNEIEKFCQEKNIECFRGNPTNLLKRYYECAKKFKGELIIRVTADNPLVDPNLIDKGILIAKKTGCDYVTNMLTPTYPYGYPVEIIKFSTLENLYEYQSDPLSKEHVTYHLRTHPEIYHIEEIFAPVRLRRSDWRLTVDNIEDFKLITSIFSRIYKPGKYILYKDLVYFLDNNQDLLDINKKFLPNKHLWSDIE